ncbi:hypothetical protein [Verrucomicrobium spinosum]|nr:hypothetical protein [Verrucomicrobium spinosum]
MSRPSLPLTHLTLLGIGVISLPLMGAGAERTPDFDRDVRPILAEHCLECHSLDKAKGGLALTTKGGA